MKRLSTKHEIHQNHINFFKRVDSGGGKNGLWQNALYAKLLTDEVMVFWSLN